MTFRPDQVPSRIYSKPFCPSHERIRWSKIKQQDTIHFYKSDCTPPEFKKSSARRKLLETLLIVCDIVWDHGALQVN